jgi:O-antigen/teichoic acid export membrane protein
MNAANGTYALVYRVIDIATIPVIAIREAAVPRLFREATNNRGKIKTLTIDLTKRTLLISTVLATLLNLSAPLIPLLVGKSFTDTVTAVRWLCFIPILRSVHKMPGNAVMGTGKQTYRTAAEMLVAAFNFGINVCWIPRYGWRGEAASNLLSDSMLACLNRAAFLYLTGAMG